MRPSRPVPIDLALQGGGSHGAFTWGVLDALLEDPRLRLDGLSGTSAGALNAGVLATGFADGGAEGARAALRAFWLDVSGAHGCFGAPGAAPPVDDLERFNLDRNPFYFWVNQWLKLFTPAQLNPFGLNRLREVAQRHVREEALRRGPLKLFITATTVSTGQPEVFQGERLSLDALLASACLPQLFSPVLIDGIAYWDGGYSGNPALWPLIYGTPTRDLVLVSINPLERPRLPASATEIADRVNEITFNAGLVGELRAIHFVGRLLKERRVDGRRYKALRLHRIADDEGLAPLQPSSKLNTDRDFLLALHELGRRRAVDWLEHDAPQLGRRSTLDVEATYLRRREPRRVA
jgi:NTE family protein